MIDLKTLSVMMLGIFSLYLLVILIGESLKEKRWRAQSKKIEELNQRQKNKRLTNKKVEL